MPKHVSGMIKVVALVGAAVIAAATIAQAVREGSWTPLWTIGWLPAVLVATFSTPRRRTACLPRLRRAGRR